MTSIRHQSGGIRFLLGGLGVVRHVLGTQWLPGGRDGGEGEGSQTLLLPPRDRFPGPCLGVWFSNVLRTRGDLNDRQSARTGGCPCGGQPHSGPGVFFR